MLVICLQIYKSLLIPSPTDFDIAFTNIEDTLKQRQDKVISTFFQRCFNVGHQRCINVENLTSDFASFSTSNQRYFNVDPTLKCWLG